MRQVGQLFLTLLVQRATRVTLIYLSVRVRYNFSLDFSKILDLVQYNLVLKLTKKTLLKVILRSIQKCQNFTNTLVQYTPNINKIL